MLNCHCRDCQLASGGPYSPTLIVANTTLTMTKGRTKCFEKPADSGNIVRREFCADCGSPLFASSLGRAGFIGIKAASLDDPAWFKPEADVWVQSAQPWDCLDPAVSKYGTSRAPRR
jgi:hypothetical protein